MLTIYYKRALKEQVDLEIDKVQKLGLDPFRHCYNAWGLLKMNSIGNDTTCQFLELLIMRSRRSNCRRKVNYFDEYLIQEVISGRQPTLERLRNYIFSGCSPRDINSDKSYDRQTLSNYLLFFPLLKDPVSPDPDEVWPLRTPDDYDIKTIRSKAPDVDKLVDPGRMIDEMLSKELHFKDFADMFSRSILEDFTESATEKIGLGKSRNLTKIVELLTYFDPNDVKVLDAAEFEDVQLKDCLAKSGDIKCEKTEEPIEESCVDYCNKVERGRKAEAFLKELFEMGSKLLRSLSKEECSWHDNKTRTPCWKTVVNEFGLCVTSYQSTFMQIML